MTLRSHCNDLAECTATPAANSCIGASERLPEFKILFIIDQLIEMGGAELALLRLVTGLQERGLQPTVITFRDLSPAAMQAAWPCPVTVIPLTNTRGRAAWKAARQIRSYIVQAKIQIVHTFFETSDLFGGLIAKSVPGVVLITSRRDMGILRNPMHRFAYRLLGRFANRVVTVSDTVRDWCIEADHIPAQRVITIYNGVEEQPPSDACRARIRSELGLSDQHLVLTSVGHIRHIKGFDLLIEAAEPLVQRYPNAIFLILGDEHESGRRLELQRLISTRTLDANVRLLSARSDIPSVLAASDIFVLPSRSEGFSNALIEAMICGLPCVATDVGGNAEAVIHGKTGFLVPGESPQDMSQALTLLAHSAGLRARMGTAGQQLARARFTQSAMVDNMLSLYRGALTDSGTRVRNHGDQHVSAHSHPEWGAAE